MGVSPRAGCEKKFHDRFSEVAALLAEDIQPALLASSDESGPVPVGHVPLLWVLVPLVLVWTFCFAVDWHAPLAGVLLLLVGVAGAWRGAEEIFLWQVSFVAGIAGLALLLFAVRVPPRVDWAERPPREAEMVVEWVQVFPARETSKTVSGVARVVGAPDFLAAAENTDVFCQVRRPVPEETLLPGARWRLRGVVSALAQQFSEEESAGFVEYLEYRRASRAVTRGSLLAVEREAPWVTRWSARQAARLEAGLRRGLEESPAQADALVGMMLGRISSLSGETRTTFARTGTMHLFAISGLHIGVIAAALFWLGKRLRAPDAAWRLGIIVVLLAFVLVTGAAPSAFRAWWMIACMLLARVARRNGSPLAGLVFAATTVLLWEPLTLLNIGFQLSYAVVAMLLLYGVPLAGWIKARWVLWRDLPERSWAWWQRSLVAGQRWLVDSLCIGLAATLASSPLIVEHFDLFSVGSLAVNLLAVPLSTPAMVLGFASLAGGALGLAGWMGWVNWLAAQILAVLLLLVEQASAVPGMALTLSYREAGIGNLLLFVMLAWCMGCSATNKNGGLRFLLPPVLILVSFMLCCRLS